MEALSGSVQAGPVPDPSREVRDDGAAPSAGGTERRFRNLVEHIPTIVYIETDGWPFPATYISPRIEQVLGYASSEFLGDHELWMQLVHPDDLGATQEAAERCTRTHDPYCVEYRLRSREGRWVWFRDEAVFVEDEEGGPGYWQGVMIDITEQKRVEEELAEALELEHQAAEQLRQANAIKDTFLQAVSHDLRSPLAAILGSAITLEHEDELGLAPEKRRELIHGLARKARKLSGLVSDLLDMERLSRRVLEPRVSPVDVGGLVARVVRESELLQGRTVHLELPSVSVAVDASMVERMVENLLGNAAKHTAVQATVWVTVETGHDGVVIAVEDDGPGVPEENREVLFDPFARPESAAGTPGHGLGLSIVARFAELHGGRAWVEDREGGGASFRVLLPFQPGAA